MPSYSITAPNGKTYRMQGPPGMTQDDLIEHVLKLAPEAGIAPPPPKTGMGAAFQSGLENMISSGKAGVKGMFGDTQEAAEEAAAAEAEQGKKYDPQLGLARLQDVYEKSGIMAAGKEMVGQGMRGIAQSAPEMGTMLGGAKLGSMAGRAFGAPGALIGGIGGGILGGILPNTGRNLAEQQRETPGEVSIGKAAAAGAGQAALEQVLPLALMGTRVASKVLGVDAAALIKRLGPEAAEEVAKRSLLSTVSRHGVVGAAGEAGTEVVQDMLTRLQAGQNLLDAEALSSYADSAYGGALPGGILSGAGGAYNRSGAKAEVADREAVARETDANLAAIQAAEAAEAAAAERARKMADPGYVQDVANRHAEYEATVKAMHAEAAELKKEGTDSGKAAFTDKLKEIAAFKKESVDLLKEFNTFARPAIKEAKLRAAAEEAERAKRYGPAVGTPATEKAPQATMFGQEKGTSDARNAARVEELQALIDEHEAGMDASAKQVAAAIGTGKSHVMAATLERQQLQDQTYQAAKQELEGLLTPEARKERAAAAEADAREKALKTLKPIAVKKQIAALQAKIDGARTGDPSELKAATGWAAQRERLESLLQEHEQRQAVPAEDLYALGDRLAGEEAVQQRAARTQDVVGRRAARQSDAFGRQLAAEDADLFSDLPKLAGETAELALNRTFATRERSGTLESLAGMESDTGPDTAALISDRLQRMPVERRAEVARELQDYGKGVKQALHAGRDAARKAGDTEREQAFSEAIRGITALEQRPDNPGRAHYEPEFYRLAEPLVPGMTEAARRVVGLGPTVDSARERALMAERAQRLQGVIDPRVTGAMEEVAAEGETIGEVPKPGRQVPPGTMPRRERLVDEEGQGMLFQPEAGPATDRASLLRQRIAGVLARPNLTRQARGTLEHADEVLTKRPISERVLEHVEEMVRNAERGVGGGALEPVKVTPEGGKRDTTALEGASVRIRDPNAPIPPRRLEGTLRAGPAPTAEAPARETAPTETYIGGRPVGKTAPPTGFGVYPAEASVRKGRVELRDRRTEGEIEEGDKKGERAVGDLPAAKRVKPQRLELEKETPAVTGLDESDEQASLFTEPATAVQRVKQVQFEGRVLAFHATSLNQRLAAARDAARRLHKLGERLNDREMDRQSMIAALRPKLLQATVAAEDASTAARTLIKEAHEAEAAEEGSGYDLRMRAAQAGRTARRHADRVDAYKHEIKLLTDRDAAAALTALADEGATLRKDLTKIEKKLATIPNKLLQARLDAGAEAKAEREAKAAAIEKSKSGEVGTMGEAKFPTVSSAREQAAKNAKAKRMAEREERDALAAKQKQLAVSSPNVQAERITAQSRPAGVTMSVEMQAEGVQDAIAEAMHVRGIDKTELQTIVDRVAGLHKKNAFPSRQGELDTEISEVLAEMRALRAQHPKGVLPKRLNDAYVAATEALAKRQAAVSETESADERAKRLRWMAGTEARIKYLDSKRVPLAMPEARNKKLARMQTPLAPLALTGVPEMHALQRRHALATFESKVLDMQQSIAEAADYQPLGADRKYVAPKRAAREHRPYDVEPASVTSGERLTRMDIAEQNAEKSAFGYKGRRFEGVTAAQERIAAEEASRQAHAVSGETLREVKTSEGKTAHKIIRENRPETEPGKEQLRPEAHTPEGVLEAQLAVARRQAQRAAETNEAKAEARAARGESTEESFLFPGEKRLSAKAERRRQESIRGEAIVLPPDARAQAVAEEREYVARQARYELLKTAVQAMDPVPTHGQFRAKQDAIVNEADAVINDENASASDKKAAATDKRQAEVLLKALDDVVTTPPKAEAKAAKKAQKAQKTQPAEAPPQTISEDAALVDRLRAEYNAAPQGAERKRLYVELNQAMARKAKRERKATDAPAREEPIDTMEGEGGRVLPRLISNLYDQASFTPLSERDMNLVHDGNLAGVLDSLAKNGSTPYVRELAAKLRTLTEGVRLKVDADVNDNGKPAAAVYDAESNTVTIHPLMLSEENLIHELGHGVTMKSMVTPPSSLTREQRNALKGLEGLLTQLKNDPSFKREYGTTNIAELASEVLSNKELRDKIDARKPGLWNRIKQAVLQFFGVKTGSAKALADVERLFQPARKFTAAEAAALNDLIGTTTPAAAARAPANAMDAFSAQLNAKATKTGLKQAVTDINAGLYAEMLAVDQRAPILKALSKGDKHAFQQSQYYVRKADARMAQVHAVLVHGGPKLKKDAKGFHTVEAGHGPSAKDVFAAIDKLPGATSAEKFSKAQAYMVAQRAANKGWHKLGWATTDQTRQLGEAMLAEVNASPQLKAQLEAVRKVYNDYNAGMVQFLADTGAIPKKMAATLLQDGDYVPFYRVGGSGVAELVMGENTHIRVGDIRKQPYLQALKGDEGKLLPLNEAIMRNTMLLMDKGLTNLATKEVAYGLQNMSPPGVNAIKRGNAPAGADIVKFNQEPDPDNDKDTGERWVRVTSEGTPFEGIPSEMLVQSLEGVHTMMTGLGKLASNFGDVLRKWVTRNPAYVIRQLIRDPMSASFTGGANRGPVAAMLKSVKEFVDQSKGSTRTGEALLKKGVTQSQIFSGDVDDISVIVHQLATGNEGMIARFISMADRAAMRADAATRVQVYEDALKATGSEMQAELAAIEMMNFTKRGSHPAVRHATRMIPFMNAQIQGLNVLAKAMRGKATMEEQLKIREKFIKNAVGLTLFSMVYAVGMEENEEYKNATAHDRINNFFVPTPWGTLKVPIPFEIGLLFKAIPEVAVHGFDDAEMKALGKMVFNTIPGASSLGAPQAVKPALELMMNKNIYTGRAIETDAQQKLAPELRYNEHTTELAKWAGETFGLSPLKIEHLVRGYLSGMPIAAASLANEMLSDKSQPTRTGSQTPLLGGFIADPLASGAVESAYEKANAIEQAGNTYDKLVKEGRVKAAKDYMEDNLNVLQAERLNDSFRADMARAKAEREKVLASSMTADAKRERIDYITKWRNAQAMRFTKAAESIVAAR